MVYPDNTLDFSIKMHSGRVCGSAGFQAFGGAKLCTHLPLDTPLFSSGCYPARLVAAPVRVSLQPDILLLTAAQLLLQLTHHAARRVRLQTRQQRSQPVIPPLQITYASPSAFLPVRQVSAQL